ncbi:MAG TPA: protein kinase [Polyangia bacterium]|nr:protein kinase [Polyangia bacterium]
MSKQPDQSGDGAATLPLDFPTQARKPPRPPGEGGGEGPPSFGQEEEDRYSIEGEHARGGLGRILKARDHRLDRPVAIKELLDNDKEAMGRFVREAMVSARLQHPAIVPIYDAGRWPSGELFYAMKLISGGRSLDQVIGDAQRLDERLALLPHVISVADAIAYAHSQRVIHRDIKPANILIGPFGETVVIDWGLAKDLTRPELEVTSPVLVEPRTRPDPSVERAPRQAPDEPDEPSQPPELTMAGSVLGTPEYMPPEQAWARTVDERADVYSLGALLYHVLAGVSPYSGTTALEILNRVRTAPPLPLTKRVPGIPEDLATIVAKAMARRPEDRYPTARELAEDLRRFQTGQLVSAYRYSRRTLIWRWVRRHRGPVAVSAAFLGLLMVLGALSVRRIVVERKVAEERSNDLVLVQSHTALERDPTAALAWLKLYPLNGAHLDQVRDLALDAWSRGVALHVLDKKEGKDSYGDFSPDGRRVAYFDEQHQVAVRDLASGAVLARHPLAGELLRARFSPNGRSLALVEWESRKLQLWDLVTDQSQELPSPEGMIISIDFSPDGRRLLVGGPAQQLRLWDLASQVSMTLDEHRGVGSELAISADSRYVAYAGTDDSVRVVDVATRAERKFPAGVGELWDLAFSSDGQRLVGAGKDGIVWLWDLKTGVSRKLVGHSGDIGDVDFSPDGRFVVSGGVDRTVRLWDVVTGQQRTLGEHLGGVTSVVFSPDGRRILSAGRDQTVRLWGVNTGEQKILKGHEATVLYVKFAPDGRHFLSASADRTTRIWPLSGTPLHVLYSDDFVTELAYSPDGRKVAVAGRNGVVWLWDARTAESRVWRGHDGGVLSVAFSPDGRQVASSGLDRTVRLWDVATGTSRVFRGHQDAIRNVIFSNDGHRVASAGVDGLVYVWDVATGQGRRLQGHEGEVRSVAFSPDDRLLVSAGLDHEVRLWTVATGECRLLRGHTARVQRAVFSPDGRVIGSAGEDGTARIWDAATGEVRRVIEQKGMFRTVTFSPDGRSLAAAGEGGLIHLCEVETGQCRRLVGHRNRVARIEFSPDGQSLVSGSGDGTVRLWDVKTGVCITTHHHDDFVTHVAFSPDGRQIASTSMDRTARLWPIESEPAPPADPAGLRAWMDTVSTAVIQRPEQSRPVSP